MQPPAWRLWRFRRRPRAWRLPCREPHFEGKDTPKICMEAGAGGFGRGGAPAGGDEEAARRIKQLGVNYVIAMPARFPGTKPASKIRLTS